MLMKELYDRLAMSAQAARALAYSPYSGVTVGAALLASSGKMYLGANVENASYSLTECAERVAIFKAVTEGEREFSAIAIDNNEVEIYSTYPQTETLVTGKIVFAIDNESKITDIVFIPYMREYRIGYIRNMYDPYDESSTLIYEHSYYPIGKQKVVDNKRIKIPENGFVIAVSYNTFASKKIMKFITPEEYSAFLDPDTHFGYYNSKNGNSLFSDILKHNELDDITVELTDNGIVLKKPLQTVDPMSVNIETLAQIVRKELQREHDKEIQHLKDRIDELEDRIDDNESNIHDNESNIQDLDERVFEIETKFSKEN